MAIIYKITNKTTNKVYIGATITKLNERWNRHVYDAKKEHDGQYIHRAIRKYGSEDFIIEQIYEDSDDIFVFNFAEGFFIEYYQSHSTKNGYNMTLGGDGWLGMKHTNETKKLIGNKNRGRTISEETRRKMSEASSGRIPWNKGKDCPELGVDKKGIRQSAEHKKASGNGILKRKLHRTEEQKSKAAEKLAETHIIQNLNTLEILTINNLHQFCKDHNLSQGNLVYYGKTKNFKMVKTIKTVRIYTIENTNTKEQITTNNLKQFCDSKGFSYNGLFQKYKHGKAYLNWKILEIKRETKEKIY